MKRNLHLGHFEAGGSEWQLRIPEILVKVRLTASQAGQKRWRKIMAKCFLKGFVRRDCGEYIPEETAV